MALDVVEPGERAALEVNEARASRRKDHHPVLIRAAMGDRAAHSPLIDQHIAQHRTVRHTALLLKLVAAQRRIAAAPIGAIAASSSATGAPCITSAFGTSVCGVLRESRLKETPLSVMDLTPPRSTQPRAGRI